MYQLLQGLHGLSLTLTLPRHIGLARCARARHSLHRALHCNAGLHRSAVQLVPFKMKNAVGQDLGLVLDDVDHSHLALNHLPAVVDG